MLFRSWNDGNTENPRTITVTGDVTYIATFETPVYYTLTVSSQNSEMGTVTGGGKYLEGTEVTITAVPNSGYVFDHWNDNNTDNPRELVMNSDMTLKAFFKSNGVDENDMTALNLYPNPARETLRIKGLEANSELLFYNTLGMLVKRVTASADEEINVSDLAPGLYLIRCNSQTIRFVKK